MKNGPRCQAGGDLHWIYALKELARQERDRQQQRSRYEAQLEPDLLPAQAGAGVALSDDEHEAAALDTWRDALAGDGVTSPDAPYLAERADPGAQGGLGATAVTARVAGGYLAIEREWYPPGPRRYFAWWYTRPEWAEDLLRWAPYTSDELNRKYREACGRLTKPRAPIRATDIEEGAEGRRAAWLLQLDVLAKTRLTPQEQEAVRLYRGGLRQGEIGARLGLSQSAVSRLLKWARDKLRAVEGPAAQAERAATGKRYVAPSPRIVQSDGHVTPERLYDTTLLKTYWQDHPERARWERVSGFWR